MVNGLMKWKLRPYLRRKEEDNIILPPTYNNLTYANASLTPETPKLPGIFWNGHNWYTTSQKYRVEFYSTL